MHSSQQEIAKESLLFFCYREMIGVTANYEHAVRFLYLFEVMTKAGMLAVRENIFVVVRARARVKG